MWVLLKMIQDRRSNTDSRRLRSTLEVNFNNLAISYLISKFNMVNRLKMGQLVKLTSTSQLPSLTSDPEKCEGNLLLFFIPSILAY